MKAFAMRGLVLATGCLLWAIGTINAPSKAPELNWYKGNLHTHTINSDGDSSPDAVARWYKEQHYNFLALTDHNYFTDPQGLNGFLSANERFLLIRGEEVTSGFGNAPVHVNALRVRSTIEPAFGDSVLSTLQKNVDRIRGTGAMPSLNHPFYRWAISAEELKQVKGLKLFEVFNGHPQTNDGGLEALWDATLSAGNRMYGVAVDDAHVFKRFAPEESNPGRGWIEVQAPELTEEALLRAIDQGDFYSSSGVKLKSMERGPGRLSLEIAQQYDEEFQIRFVGAGGRILKTETGMSAQHQLRPGDGYVRASVVDSNGRQAWTQPVFAD